ncbi:MAG: hypothetical protein H9W81_15510 [Enterococcus sp.]|nr:hypothetical protein [Enterococcus sp.]
MSIRFLNKKFLEDDIRLMTVRDFWKTFGKPQKVSYAEIVDEMQRLNYKVAAFGDDEKPYYLCKLEKNGKFSILDLDEYLTSKSLAASLTKAQREDEEDKSESPGQTTWLNRLFSR